MPWRPLSAAQADALFATFKSPLLESLHAMILILSCVLVWRGEKQYGLFMSVGFVHSVALLICRWQGGLLSDPRAAERTRKARILANIMGLTSWVLRSMVRYRWSNCAPCMAPVLARALGSGWGFTSEMIVSVTEQLHTLMLLPAGAVACWLAVYLSWMYSALKLMGIQPGPLGTVVWALVQVSLPHLVIMSNLLKGRSDTSRPAGLATAAGGGHRGGPRAPPAKPCTPDEAHHQKLASLSDGGAGGSNGGKCQADAEDDAELLPLKKQLQGSSVPDSSPADAEPHHSSGAVSSAELEAPQQEPAEAPDHVPAAQNAEPSTPQGAPAASPHPHDLHETRARRSTAPEAQGATARGAPPPPGCIQALQNARALMSRASNQDGLYVSRCIHSKVIVKLNSVEPEKLSPDVISATNRILSYGRAQVVVVRGGVRRGCTLISLDVRGTPGSEAPALGSHAEASVQAWLQALLAAGSHLPDGAVAHISIGDQELEAEWHQQHGGWVVRQAARAEAPAHLALMGVDQPVVRLPTMTPAASRNMHRVTLLLRATNSKRSIKFEAPEPNSVPAEQPGDDGRDAPTTVQCVAHGSWGSYLPVKVEWVEMNKAGDADKISSASAGGSIEVSVTLDVDLSQAPRGGVVQLELWCGRSLLASAPLLLLPPLVSAASDPLLEEPLVSAASDPLLEELLQLVQLCGWDTAQDGGGISAWLTDLGQVLHTVGCIAKPEPDGSHTVGGDSPGSWGGVVQTLARLHTSDPALLSTTLVITGSLLELTHAASLPHTADLLTSCTAQVQQQLDQVQSLASDVTAGSSDGQDSLQDMMNNASANCSSASHEAPAESSSELDAPKDGLRHRPLKGSAAPLLPGEGGGGAATPSPTATKSAMKNQAAASGVGPSSPAAQHHDKQGQQSPFQAGQSSVIYCIKCALTGFRSPPGLESRYALWTGKYMNRVVFTHSLLLVLWTVASILRTALGGWASLVSYLPLHLICGIPYLASTLLAAHQQHEWQEWVLALHSVGRSIATVAAAAGVLPFPPTYSVMCKIRFFTWGEVGFFSIIEVMRLPALLVAHTFLFAFDIGLRHICGQRGWPVMAQALGLRACALAVGLGLDAARRMTFKKEVPTRGAGTPTQHS